MAEVVREIADTADIAASHGNPEQDVCGDDDEPWPVSLDCLEAFLQRHLFFFLWCICTDFFQIRKRIELHENRSNTKNRCREEESFFIVASAQEGHERKCGSIHEHCAEIAADHAIRIQQDTFFRAFAQKRQDCCERCIKTRENQIVKNVKDTNINKKISFTDIWCQENESADDGVRNRQPEESRTAFAVF